MTSVVTAEEAKQRISDLLERAEHGEEIVIERAGRAVARLVPAEEAPEPPRRGPIRLGTAKGMVTFKPGWDDPMTDEEIAEWEDGPIFPPATDAPAD